MELSNTLRLVYILGGYFATIVVVDLFLTQNFKIAEPNLSFVVMIVAAVIFQVLFMMVRLVRKTA